MSTSQKLPHLIPRITLCFVLVCPLIPRSTCGQAARVQPDRLTTEIARVKSGDVNAAGVVYIADARAVQAIPALEEQFGRATDVDLKDSIASCLVRLGDRDNTYWNFLLEQATLAVDSDIPDGLFDPRGKIISDLSSPELVAWAKAHSMSVNDAMIMAEFDVPGKVMELGFTGDSRGIPLLRRALQSHNSFIIFSAATGLATIGDKDSIPLIIAACQRAPEGLAPLIARSLVYFDDPQAQTAVDTYMSKEAAAIARDARAHGSRPFGYSSYP